MNKILVTAFNAFNGKGYNPSEQLLSLLDNENIEKVVLPTSYKRAAQILRMKVEETKPSAVICMGLASGRIAISLEFVALNIKDASIPDNDNEKASGESVIPGAPNALFTSLNLGHYAKIIRDNNIPCMVSYHAGTFVCNSTYYHLLTLDIPGVFIHIPDDEKSVSSKDKPYLPLETSKMAISIFIEELKKNL